MEKSFKIVFRSAEADDLNGIMELIRAAIGRMRAQGIDQWDELYPCKDDFAGDIENGEAYVGICDDRIAAIYTINDVFDDAYRSIGIRWNDPLIGSACIHRLCVQPDLQGCGIGRRTLQDAEARLADRGFGSVKLDVYTQNPAALKMYKNAGYERKGSAIWRKGCFDLLEKHIGH